MLQPVGWLPTKPNRSALGDYVVQPDVPWILREFGYQLRFEG
jgi:hypothetical protein